MIGRLVEEEDIGVGSQHAREAGAARLAAGQMRRIFLPGEAELLQETKGGVAVIGVMIVDWPQPGLHVGQRRRKA